jgi:potassium efflux system protein
VEVVRLQGATPQANRSTLTRVEEVATPQTGRPRPRVAIGVSYESDIDLATELIVAAARETERVLDEPPPQCYIVGFGDSAVDFELRYRIGDPQAGVSNIADGVLRKVWHKFRQHGVRIPSPQRDLHLKTPHVIAVNTQPSS